MELRAKLQIPEGASIRVVDCPRGMALGLGSAGDDSAGILLFVRDSRALTSRGSQAIAAAKKDMLVWLAYPKAGQLATDLSRDRLSALLEAKGIQPVRQVSIDETWSALRFRPLNKR